MERLLGFAVTHSPIEMTDLQNEFGEDVVKWLVENDVRVLEKLKAFVNGKLEPERRLAFEAFKHDRQFDQFLSDPSFRFQMNLSSKEALHAWLKQFYKQLTASGFHPLICKNHSSNFQKNQWWELFSKENPNQAMCVICDGMMTDKKSIEHYLPISLYPSLSIHPANLVPMCQTCNGGKQSYDPLDGRNITEIFFPYRDTVSQVIDLEFFPVSIEREEITIKPIGAAPELNSQLSHYTNIYQIPKRWNDGFDDITMLAMGKLRDRVVILREEGVSIDREKFLAAIERTAKQLEKDWGTFPYGYPASKWLLWVKDHKFESLFTELSTV